MNPIFCFLFMKMENCENLIPAMLVDLLKAYGVDDMRMEWSMSGKQKGQPLTLTLRWQPELKEGRRKSPSTRRHERERSLQYFEKRRRMARDIKKEDEDEENTTDYDIVNGRTDDDLTMDIKKEMKRQARLK